MGIPLFGVLGIYLDQVHARAIKSGCDMSELKSLFDPQGMNRHNIYSVKHQKHFSFCDNYPCQCVNLYSLK